MSATPDLPAGGKEGRWFADPAPTFDAEFGPDWRKGNPDFRNGFKNLFVFSREELGQIL